MRYETSIAGNKYGRWTALYRHSNTRNKNIKYVCQCDCGVISSVLKSHLVRGNTTSCGCIQKESVGKLHKDWSGRGEISGQYWSMIKHSAKRRRPGRQKLEWGIDIEFAWDLFLHQDKRCALSGLPIQFGRHRTASLDRIDSGDGYTRDNVQWVHKDINLMKNKFTMKHFVQLCKLVSESCDL